MIPSRPLDIGGIINETIRIVKRIFTRSAFISLVCLLPGMIVCLVSVDEIGSSLETFSNQYTQAAPETSRLFRDYLALKVANEPGLTYYRFQYHDVFAALDSVRASLLAGQPELTPDSISSKLDSIRLLVKAKTGQSTAVSFLESIEPGLILLAIGALILILGSFARTGALIDLSCRVFEERPLPLGAVFRLSLTRSMWLIAIQYLLIALGMLFGMAIVIGITMAISAVLGVLGVLASFALILYAVFRVMFCGVALVSEELPPVAAIKRSLDLTEGYFWRVVGISLIVGLMIFTIGAILGIPISLMSVVPQDFLVSYIQSGVGLERIFAEFNNYVRILVIGSFATGLLTASFSPAFGTTFYYDLRTRRDGPLEYDAPSDSTDDTPNPPEILAA